MGKSLANLQETFLNLCRKENARCIVYLVNGVQLRGSIRAFDNFTILLEDEGKQQIVYKHAITTVQPLKRIPDVDAMAYRLAQEEAAEVEPVAVPEAEE